MIVISPYIHLNEINVHLKFISFYYYLENRFRRDVQNTSDGKQGLSGEGQQKKVFSNRSGEQQKNG